MRLLILPGVNSAARAPRGLSLVPRLALTPGLAPALARLMGARLMGAGLMGAGLTVAGLMVAGLTVAGLMVPATAYAQPVPPAWPAAPSGSEPAPDRGADDNDDRALLERTSNRANLRLGMASADTNDRPVVCLEVRAIAGLSVEGCGTGNGFLHNAPGASITHFRGKWQLARRVVSRGVFQVQIGAGMAELQIASDRPGFVIDPGADDAEAIGPEGVIALQWLRPMGGGWEFVLNTTAGLAWIPGADDLYAPQDTVQPFVGLEIGAGW